MKIIKLLFQILTIIFCITLSSCNGKVSETGGTSGSSGDTRKEVDRIMSACKYVYERINTNDKNSKKIADMYDYGINVGYKCPSSAVPNIIDKYGSDIWYKSEKVAAPDGIACKELRSQDADTLIEYEKYKIGVIGLEILDCINNQYYYHEFKEGEL